MARESRASSRLCFFLFVSLFLSALSSAEPLDSPPHAEVLAHNQQAAASLSHDFKPSWVSEHAPSVEQPITWAYLYLGPASPSVSGRVSSLHPPAVFWTWGEHHESHVEENHTSGPPCNEELKTTLSNPTTPVLTGVMTWSAGTQNISVPYEAQSANPVASPLSSAAWLDENLPTIQGPNQSSVLPPLTISFDGYVLVNYTRSSESVVATFDKGVLTCLLHPTIDNFTASRRVTASRNWSIEHGEPLFMRLEPADGEQLSLHPNARLLTLANRNPQHLSIFLNSTLLAASRFSRYDIASDEFGFESVQRLDIEPMAEWAVSILSDTSTYLLNANSTFLYLLPTALDEQNRSFAWQFSQFLRYPLPLGVSALGLKMEDDFNDQWNITWQMRTRSASGIGGLESQTASLNLLDARANPLLPPATDLGGGASRARLPPSDQWREAQAIFFTPSRLPLLFGGIFGILICAYLFVKVGPKLSLKK